MSDGPFGTEARILGLGNTVWYAIFVLCKNTVQDGVLDVRAIKSPVGVQIVSTLF